ncbi:hypothetical protein NDU88_003337 [Pleurodeles waltl]|uniref:Uncharacterized protein n=1 Tax=Pleurodeles waltl TaxID=8319 RepID=A0AAV7RCK7_PLEWA|nr:hypothetical protein NDU88_003337 [Pleurodeles waltl]
MPPDLLVDPVCREATRSALMDYLEFNWQSTTTKALGWEALQIVMRGACMGVTCGVRDMWSAVPAKDVLGVAGMQVSSSAGLWGDITGVVTPNKSLVLVATGRMVKMAHVAINKITNKMTVNLQQDTE